MPAADRPPAPRRGGGGAGTGSPGPRPPAAPGAAPGAAAPADLRVLVAHARPATAQEHRALVDRVPGFRTVGLAADGDAALARAVRGGVDLLLLDLALPGRPGLDVCRALQHVHGAPDVLVATAVRDRAAVRAALRFGAVHYLVTPLRFAALRERLDAYAAYRANAAGHRALADQGEVDALVATLRPPCRDPLPKGLARESLDLVRAAVHDARDGVTADEAAAATGLSRVTARRYLEHLVDRGVCRRAPRYGGGGRPPLRYVGT
ncbi:response regulator [Cellulomonas sp. ACRRI]|uniref:response regulator n=1 Tax=Cellulomonas sp. ACRRI TaxID=2918188 RepID=UPI001EF2A5EF|nr:response regulator [Cellulomonas sp. ACRRI]MCG7286169.1 response regulator [Cellulomonas sp. ACRRI]